MINTISSVKTPQSVPSTMTIKTSPINMKSQDSVSFSGRNDADNAPQQSSLSKFPSVLRNPFKAIKEHYAKKKEEKLKAEQERLEKERIEEEKRLERRKIEEEKRRKEHEEYLERKRLEEERRRIEQEKFDNMSIEDAAKEYLKLAKSQYCDPMQYKYLRKISDAGKMIKDEMLYDRNDPKGYGEIKERKSNGEIYRENGDFNPPYVAGPNVAPLIKPGEYKNDNFVAHTYFAGAYPLIPFCSYYFNDSFQNFEGEENEWHIGHSYLKPTDENKEQKYHYFTTLEYNMGWTNSRNWGFRIYIEGDVPKEKLTQIRDELIKGGAMKTFDIHNSDFKTEKCEDELCNIIYYIKESLNK